MCFGLAPLAATFAESDACCAVASVGTGAEPDACWAGASGATAAEQDASCAFESCATAAEQDASWALDWAGTAALEESATVTVAVLDAGETLWEVVVGTVGMLMSLDVLSSFPLGTIPLDWGTLATDDWDELWSGFADTLWVAIPPLAWGVTTLWLAGAGTMTSCWCEIVADPWLVDAPSSTSLQWRIKSQTSKLLKCLIKYFLNSIVKMNKIYQDLLNF